MNNTIELKYYPGLDGIAAIETALSKIQADPGLIFFRDHLARTLIARMNFEEIASYLWFGAESDTDVVSDFKSSLASNRRLPPHVISIIDSIPTNYDYMTVLQIAISSLSEGFSVSSLNDEFRIASAIPTIIIYRYQQLCGSNKPAYEATDDLVEYYFTSLIGRKPLNHEKICLEKYLSMIIELGSNPSTFAARLVTSTKSDIYSAISAALGTLTGELHGGAPSKVINMLESIGSNENARCWIQQHLLNKKPIMGFGHRIFKTTDPRSRLLFDLLDKYYSTHPLFILAKHVESVVKEEFFIHKGTNIATNVDYYSSVLLTILGIPKQLLTPTFAVGRCFGWLAHIKEQSSNNRIIYPLAICK